jgi:hypothetical protein
MLTFSSGLVDACQSAIAQHKLRIASEAMRLFFV